MEFINTPEDCQWLRDVHAKGAPAFASFVLQGNEDAPDSLVLYAAQEPNWTNMPVAVYVDGEPQELPDVDAFFSGYTECALWASPGDDGEEDLQAYDIHPGTLASMRADCAQFIGANCLDLIKSGLPDENAGHDFWLTRCGHGAGFWDRGLGDVGERLSDAAQACGNVDLYVGNDGYVHD